jgi:hypothetical protein
MIVVNSSLLRDTRFKDDPEWNNFLINYFDYGYVQMQIPGTDKKLILRNILLHGE